MKRKDASPADIRVKRKRIRWIHAVITYGVMLLLVGIQVGIIVIPAFHLLSDFWKINIILLYWAVVAGVFAYITNRQIKNGYDAPMRKLGEATRQVAGGDFSVYMEPAHTADQYDYIDVMFLDFNKMVEELGSIETLKNDFISNVSHELKTPLSIIKNTASLIKKANLSAEMQAEYATSIMEATDRLSALITNILRLNKLENQAIESAAEPYDLCRQLTDCLLQFEPLWDKKELEIEVDIEDRAIITADASIMEIVWNNLISNAIKFTEPGGKIELRQMSDTHLITVSVSDSGCGMDEETMKHIFDKFYQGDPSHAKEGNGLGLALVQRIVERAGGTLSVESHPGTGSAFTVQLHV